MSDKRIKIPGPDHPISIEANPSRVVVKVCGKTIADTSDALTLREASYPAVQYIPRRDVDMAALTRSEHTTYCPYKGDASYYSIPAGGDRSLTVVTGGTAGIGFATAKRFVDEGAYVFITGRRQKELDEAIKAIGRNIAGVQGDVSKLQDLDRLYETVKAKGH